MFLMGSSLVVCVHSPELSWVFFSCVVLPLLGLFSFCVWCLPFLRGFLLLVVCLRVLLCGFFLRGISLLACVSGSGFCHLGVVRGCLLLVVALQRVVRFPGLFSFFASVRAMNFLINPARGRALSLALSANDAVRGGSDLNTLAVAAWSTSWWFSQTCLCACCCRCLALSFDLI